MTDLVDPTRVVGMLLGAAVGDALGWPQEDRSNIVGGDAARAVEPGLSFRTWDRSAGSQYQRYRETVRAGDYSDDTQLMLASARACLHDARWVDWLRRVELPMWPLYQRGGGGAVLRAARAWSEGKTVWIAKNDRDRARVASYFRAGANGVAMRISPHVAWTARDPGPDQLIERCVLDGISTHGHPRALVGGIVYALALRFALTERGTLGYGSLLEQVLAERRWQESEFVASVVQHTNSGWMEAFRQTSDHTFDRAWSETVHEMQRLLAESSKSLRDGAMAKDEDTLDKLGVFGKSKGAGTITAAATLYIATRTAARPASGLLRSSFLRSADSDTLASMTAGLLGALHGSQWMGALDQAVQDHQYIERIARWLVQQKDDNLEAPPTRIDISVTAANIRRFTDALFDAPGSVDHLPDGRTFEIVGHPELSATGGSIRPKALELRTHDGQSLLITHVERAREATPLRPRTRVETIRARAGNETPGNDQQPQLGHFATIHIAVRDLRRSAAFYKEVLSVDVTQHGENMYIRPGLFLLPRSQSQAAIGTNSILITLHVHDLDLIETRLTTLGHEGWRRTDPNTLRLRDLDGYELRLIVKRQ